MLAILCIYATNVWAWDEHVGTGKINGQEFPIAVIRNSGNPDIFYQALRKRFGSKHNITVLPTSSGIQYLVQEFDVNVLETLPFRNSPKAIDQFILDHTMSFTLFSIADEFMAIGTPLSVFGKVVPIDIGNSLAFNHLIGMVDRITEISFKFANVEISSLHGYVNNNKKLTVQSLIRSEFKQKGLNPTESVESQVIKSSDDAYEFYMDGRNAVANFSFIASHATNEVILNVNKIEIR